MLGDVESPHQNEKLKSFHYVHFRNTCRHEGTRNGNIDSLSKRDGCWGTEPLDSICQQPASGFLSAAPALPVWVPQPGILVLHTCPGSWKPRGTLLQPRVPSPPSPGSTNSGSYFHNPPPVSSLSLSKPKRATTFHSR